MKKVGMLSILILVLSVVTSSTFAATDGFYQLSQLGQAMWDGTDANRQETKTADYTYAYGDESSITYTMPWAFTFYGQEFTEFTADTNGNIWFGSTGPANAFNLANNGRGPVIAAWNNDLSSYYYGGVFIQHKTNPDQVVIEWQTETYTTEGLKKPNSFEAVLFPNGEIRLDYNSFTSTSTNEDFGSGISLNDGTYNINLTNEIGNVFTLAGQSFLFTPSGSTNSLDVAFIGDGAGSVISNLGVSWSTGHQAQFPTGTQVTLQANPISGHIFNGWSGPCSGLGSCTFTLNQDTIVTSGFFVNLSPQVLDSNSGMKYSSLQSAYDVASDGSVLQLTATSFRENFDANQNKTIIIEGGYTGDFSSNPGISYISGTSHIRDGTVKMNNIHINY